MWSIWKGPQITICTLFKYCSVKAQTLFKLFKLCSNIKQTSNKYQFYALVKYTLWMMFWGSTGWPITSGTSVRLVRFWLFYYSTRAVWHTSLGNSPDQSSKPRSNTALPWAGKGDRPYGLDLAEDYIKENHISKEIFDFDQGTRKYEHILFNQSTCLPPQNHILWPMRS